MLRRLLVLLVLFPVALFAEDRTPADTESAIRARLGAAMKDAKITSVSPTPVAGLYEVVLDGSESAFVSADGQYLITGDMFQSFPGKGLVNITEQKASRLRRTALLSLDSAQLITFPAKGSERGELWAYTDIDCGYCRKLHQEIEQTNAGGVTVHYLAFPRAGVDSETGRKMTAVWCAANRQKAMTEAKRGSSVPPASAACKSPVGDQYRLGVAMGVRGTPAVFDREGNHIGGYLPAKDLIARAVAAQ